MIAVVHDNVIEMVDLRGHPKTTKKIGMSKFEFDFKVDGMGKTESRLISTIFNFVQTSFQLSYKMTAFSPSTRTECREDR